MCACVYTCAGNFSEEEVHTFLVESIQMKEFSHPHVMGLLGVCLDAGPSPYLVLPFMAGGSLLDHLKKKRSELVLTQDSETDVCTPEVKIILITDYSYDITLEHKLVCTL